MTEKQFNEAETEDWKLSCFLDWKPKKHQITCPYCNGKGEVGGGFKDIDGPRQCPECFGSRHVTKGPSTVMPAIPEALREHMRRAWWDYFNKPQPDVVEQFTCLAKKSIQLTQEQKQTIRQAWKDAGLLDGPFM